MRTTRTALGALLLSTAIAAGACATGDDAVVTGPETFEFVSPNGEVEIYYDPPADRKPVAEITGPDLLDPEVTLNLQQDHAGEVVVLNTWGQWCGPCRSEADDLQAIQEEFGPQGATVFGINLRDPNRQKPVDFVEDNGITYPSIWDPSNAAVAALRGFPTSVVPTTPVLDREHRVAAVYLTEITEDKLSDTVSRLLAEDGDQA